MGCGLVGEEIWGFLLVPLLGNPRGDEVNGPGGGRWPITQVGPPGVPGLSRGSLVCTGTPGARSRKALPQAQLRGVPAGGLEVLVRGDQEKILEGLCKVGETEAVGHSWVFPAFLQNLHLKFKRRLRLLAPSTAFRPSLWTGFRTLRPPLRAILVVRPCAHGLEKGLQTVTLLPQALELWAAGREAGGGWALLPSVGSTRVFCPLLGTMGMG